MEQMDPTSPDEHRGLVRHPDEPHEGFLERLREAAEEAERQTGFREETPEQLHRSLAIRLARTVAGFALVIVGLAAIPLPGPGWLIVVVGLSLLPYAWAERTILLIRRRIPGVPEDGRIPTHTWIIMAVLVAAATTASLLWADDVGSWVRDLT